MLRGLIERHECLRLELRVDDLELVELLPGAAGEAEDHPALGHLPVDQPAPAPARLRASTVARMDLDPVDIGTAPDPEATREGILLEKEELAAVAARAVNLVPAAAAIRGIADLDAADHSVAVGQPEGADLDPVPERPADGLEVEGSAALGAERDGLAGAEGEGRLAGLERKQVRLAE